MIMYSHPRLLVINRTRTVVDKAGYAINAVSERYKDKWKYRALDAEQAVAQMTELLDDLEDDVENLQDVVSKLRAENIALRGGTITR